MNMLMTLVLQNGAVTSIRNLSEPQYLSGNVSNDTIAPSQEEHTDALGVRNRGKTWDSRTQENNVVNTTIIPSQEGHAESLGVSRNFPNLRKTVSKSCLMKTSANG
jgi:hypothetical protein